MRRSITLAALAIGLTLGGAVHGDQTPPKPPSPYPMSADAFRAIIDKMIDGLRSGCAKVQDCPKAYIESGITQMKFRTLEACRDGVVTETESRWVLQSKPTIPQPPPPPPRPGPPPDDDDRD